MEEEKKGKNIFVSHQHDDAPKIADLLNLIKEAGYVVRDSSNYEDKSKNRANDPEYIKTLIRPAIDWAGTVIVLIGEETKNSDWVNWEIDYAGKNDKKIVGVFLPGADESDIPESFKVHGAALCGWRSNSIANALEGETDCETAGGAARTNPIGYKIKRYNCKDK